MDRASSELIFIFCCLDKVLGSFFDGAHSSGESMRVKKLVTLKLLRLRRRLEGATYRRNDS